MMEKCDLTDAVHRMQRKEKKAELDKVKGFAKLWPMIRPKFALYTGIFLLGIS